MNAYCGDIDLIGQQKAPSLLRDVVWGLSPLELVVERPVPDGKVEVPRAWGWHDEHRSWTWPGAEGKPLTVRVYTTGTGSNCASMDALWPTRLWPRRI